MQKFLFLLSRLPNQERIGLLMSICTEDAKIRLQSQLGQIHHCLWHQKLQGENRSCKGVWYKTAEICKVFCTVLPNSMTFDDYIGLQLSTVKFMVALLSIPLDDHDHDVT